MAGPEGFLNLYKPSGCSSRHLVDEVCKALKLKRVGHAGTLDPLASGVLVIAVGQATKYVQYAQQGRKSYLATFQFGLKSETDDTEGQVQQVDCPETVTQKAIAEILRSFEGEIDQVPPAFSAKKVKGRRAYSLARKGVAVDLKPARVTIDHLRIVSLNWPLVELDIQCSHGTYIRSIGRDIAAALQTSAVMTKLVRTAVGPFQLNNTCTLNEQTKEQLEAELLPLDAPFRDFPEILLTETLVIRIRHGQRLWINDFPNPPEVLTETVHVLRHQQTNQFIGLGIWTDDNVLQPRLLIAQQ